MLRTFRASVWGVCVLALLLMLGAPTLHACVDATCGIEHAVDEHSSCPDKEDCPSEQDCCQMHCCMGSTVPERMAFLFVAKSSRSNVAGDEACGEGPCREIDHPPQLS